MTEVSMKIDGRDVKAEHRSPILGAIRSLGIEVPTLCHLEGLEPYGVCRMCVVEAKRGRRTRLVTSCNYPAEEGLEIFTDTDRVRQHRRVLAELLLARCPDVPRIRELAASVGVKKSRFKTVGQPSDCVMCGLCVRVCNQYVGASALSFIGRGNLRVVGTPWSVDTDACIACGACAYVCPTGAMHMEDQTVERWRRELASDQRLCRYARMGLISFKICPNDFRCSECEVDQRLFEELGTHPLLALAPGLRRLPKRVGPFDVVEDRYYSRGHTWVKFARDHVRVGMDDFACKLLGTAREVTLHARPDDAFKPGDPAATVASDGRKATLRFPISGTVMHVNRVLQDDPALVNADCYERGWLFEIRADDFYAQTRRLVGRDEVEPWIEEQSEKLARILKAGSVSELTQSFSERLGGEDFARLDGEFFKAEAAPEK
jgi:bidirectional [NiFe] hydrogenase diaphorase subunit